jgi:hypothetical protein
MKNVPAPNGNHFADFKSLVKRKHSGVDRTILASLFQDIEARYDEYNHNKTKPELVTIVNRLQDEEAALKSCYDNSVKFKAGLGAATSAAMPTPRCPYCQIDPARTWDHFLPAALFPDYYVYPPNLLRVCSSCNEGKNVGRVHPIRKTLHPYYDPLSKTRYLKCTIERRAKLTAIFSIDPDRTAHDYDAYIEEVARKHFDSYDLARKFCAESSRMIGDFEREIKDIFEITNSLPDQKWIDRIIGSQKKALLQKGEGPNNWEIAFWDGMNDFPGLLKYAKDLL